MFKNKGFTLIEFMIVVAIVGILLAIIIPVFQDKTPHTSNYCTVQTISKYYTKVNRDSIVRDSEIIRFSLNNKTVEVSAYNTDIVCNGY